MSLAVDSYSSCCQSQARDYLRGARHIPIHREMPQINDGCGLRSTTSGGNHSPVQALVDGNIRSRAGSDWRSEITADLREGRAQNACRWDIDDGCFVERLISDDGAVREWIDADGVRHWRGASRRPRRWP